MSKDFNQAIKERRSIYGISNEKIVSKEKIEEIVKYGVNYSPSSFNSQSSRVVILFDDNHEKLWEMIKETIRKIVPAEAFAQSEEKLNSFKAGYGTVLYFEDQSVIENLQAAFSLYKDNFPIWSLQSSGMLQYVVWTSLEMEGLGASLQHYNELVENQLKEEFDIPKNWKLLAQMPFGKPIAAPNEKEFMPIENRVFVK